MPRVSALRLAALEDLAEQLRFAPARTVRAQLKRALSLAADLRAERNYPEDWVVQRITGFRPEMDNPATLIGEALLGELSAFTERVSDAARLRPEDAPAGSLRVEDLCARWRVSRKSVERFRRRGLVALRVRDARGRSWLAFPGEGVEAFEARRQGGIDKAAGFTRMDTAQAQRAARAGARAMRRYGWSRLEAARRLAARHGRSVEAMRQLLLRSGGESPMPKRAQREAIFEALERGERTRDVAARFAVSPQSVRRAHLQARAERLAGLPLPAHSEAALAPTARAGLRVAIETSLREWADAGADDAPPDLVLERELASSHRALLARAGGVIAGLNLSAPTKDALERAERDLRWAALLRVRLVQMHRKPVLQAVESAAGGRLGDLAPGDIRRAHAAAFVAAAGAAAEFDPARGGRLAAAIVLAVQRALARLSLAPRRAPGSPALAAPAGLRLDDWRTRVASWQAWLDLTPEEVEAVAGLEDSLASVVRLRHALGGEPPMTTPEIGERLGVTALLAARRERRALRALRGGDADAPAPRSG